MRDKARPGDLLFYKVTPQSGCIARLIAVVQMIRGEGTSSTQYSHVSIVARSTDKQIEAWWPRVRESMIDWSSGSIELWRINNIDYKQASDIVTHAMKSIGEWYDLGEFLLGLFPSKQRHICTTLVKDAAESVGITLAASAGDFITPNELRDDPQLRRVA
jgi:hypothetical protein